MSEILSQSQIDLLLSSLTSGEKQIDHQDQTSGKKVKEYDFQKSQAFYKRAVKASVQHLRKLRETSFFPHYGILQTYCMVEIIEVEEQHYYEFNNALPDSVLIGVLDFAVKEDQTGEDLVAFGPFEGYRVLLYRPAAGRFGKASGS
jgi:flagellar motor switch protein FliM